MSALGIAVLATWFPVGFMAWTMHAMRREAAGEACAHSAGMMISMGWIAAALEAAFAPRW